MISTNVDLSHANTMRLPCRAAASIDVASEADLKIALDYARQHALPIRVLGGGSNVLLPEQLQALVLRPTAKGISIIEEADGYRVTAKAGEIWHDFVTFLLEQGVHGYENLALIPGLVGASVIQNIGAYGVELGDYLVSVTVFDFHTQEMQTFSKQACELAYRDSRFKREANRYFVYELCFSSPKQAALNANYPALQSYFNQHNILAPSHDDLYQAVIEVRQSKLPDPALIPNSGSFFKNPLVTAEKAAQLKKDYPDMPQYKQVDGSVKLAAGWLIEQLGWKGKGIGPVSMYEKQALVMVNNKGCFKDVAQLRDRIISQCGAQFGVSLEVEPARF